MRALVLLLAMSSSALADVPQVHVPVPVPELSTKRLLTMTWLDGRPLMKRLEEDPPPSALLAKSQHEIAKYLFLQGEHRLAKSAQTSCHLLN